ncbi:FAD-dependent monooxygenase [Variovorax sp. HJSM1_2]|uniref:FAD-dependent monooxygenase n=1 Tax=Variovorax sp. HJSM1_2 TaxID=3366263 RepID=UPI003BE26BD1
MSPIRRVAIIGAGLAGLACAVAVTRAGLAVDVYASDSIGSAEDLHLDAVPNLVRSLDRLGILVQCQGLGFAYSRTRTTDASGRILESLPLPRLAGDGKPAGLGLLQNDLLRALSSRAIQQGAQVYPCTPAIAIESGAGVVHLADASKVDADLVLLAAGLDAPLRRSVFVHAPQTTCHEQQWWHLVLPRAPGMDHPTMMVGRRGQKLHVVPIAPTKAGLTFCTSSFQPLEEQTHAQILSAALRNFSGWPAAWQEVLRDNPPLVISPVREALLPQPWHCDRVLAVGDSAHAVVPHFGQGPAQALEDAVVLQELLMQRLSVAELMTSFTARRLGRVKKVHELTGRAALWDEHPVPSTDMRALSQALAEVLSKPA